MTGTAPQSDDLSSFVLELRRGAIVLAVLAEHTSEHYGYSLKKSLLDKGLKVDEGTLYPLLRRLESQGLLDSRWEIAENRPRRYYRLSTRGAQVLRSLTAEWNNLNQTIGSILHGKQRNEPNCESGSEQLDRALSASGR